MFCQNHCSSFRIWANFLLHRKIENMKNVFSRAVSRAEQLIITMVSVRQVRCFGWCMWTAEDTFPDPLHLIFHVLHFISLHYRPHPKDGEGTVFTGVCLSTPEWGGGGIHLHPIILPLAPCPFWGVPSDWSQVPSRGYPSPRWEVPQSQAVPQYQVGYPILGYPPGRT